jgi:hypothetical protein
MVRGRMRCRGGAGKEALAWLFVAGQPVKTHGVPRVVLLLPPLLLCISQHPSFHLSVYLSIYATIMQCMEFLFTYPPIYLPMYVSAFKSVPVGCRRRSVPDGRLAGHPLLPVLRRPVGHRGALAPSPIAHPGAIAICAGAAAVGRRGRRGSTDARCCQRRPRQREGRSRFCSCTFAMCFVPSGACCGKLACVYVCVCVCLP